MLAGHVLPPAPLFEAVPPGPPWGYHTMSMARVRGLDSAVDPRFTLDHQEAPHNNVASPRRDLSRPWSDQQDLSMPRYMRHIGKQEQNAVQAHEIRKDRWWSGPCRWAH